MDIPTDESNMWRIFRGDGKTHDGIGRLPPPPPWRAFYNDSAIRRQPPEATIKAPLDIEDREVNLVNAALYLRRPLLVTGKPGAGKSSLAYAIAHELQLGAVLRWSITTRSTLQESLYQYDAIAWAQALSGAEAPAQPISATMSSSAPWGQLSFRPNGREFYSSMKSTRATLICQMTYFTFLKKVASRSGSCFGFPLSSTGLTSAHTIA